MNGLNLQERVFSKIQDLTSFLVNTQQTDGAWYYCFEAGLLTDAYMIILLRHLGMNDETLIQKLAHRIASKQEPTGAWKVFYDEPEGNLSTTIECYYALLLAGYKKKTDPEMIKAREFILAKGGLTAAGSYTITMLAITGHYPWENAPYLPVEMVLLPTWSPVNFFDFNGYARVHVAPISICASNNYVHKLPGDADLSDLFSSSKQMPSFELPQFLRKEIEKYMKEMPVPFNEIHNFAIKKLERFILARLEWDGTLYSYFTTTLPMIFALLALGYDKRHPVITKAVAGLKAMACRTVYHLQTATSTIWDTGLIAYALQEADLSPHHPAIEKATLYLLAKQHTKYGDWMIHNPQGRPGGWGFSHSNTINPDVDDTAYTLRALYRQAVNNSETYGHSWRAGLDWLLTMQNDDGGWPAFEKNTNKKWLDLLPITEAKSVLTDPSAADLTGRALEFLGNYAGMSHRQEQVQKAVQWLIKDQRSDGSWYGRWGVVYIYGTWAAVTGLTAVGIDPQHQTVKKAVNWLLSIQNSDGGWGESALSDSLLQYTPLGFSTPSQTAWALDALIATGLKESPAVIRGIEALIQLTEKNGIATSYPTGAGVPGGFYIHYHSYRYIWPLLALSHYLRVL